MQYRREIDGLRAVAVVPVILFHAGFQVFSGGYVGVDIFFVISGYLITTILIDECHRGTYSLIKFYERRARRILPALFLVMAVCVPFAWMWMPPFQFEDYARSMAFAAGFASNVHFWENTGYFALDAEAQPLLHTWSLAVEEQFYLLFPLLLVLLGKFRRFRFLTVFAIMALLSLALSEWGWRNYPDENFFFTFSRFWELLVGSICAVILFQRKQKGNEWLAALGLGLIVYTILFFDDTIPFPSIYALVPVIGTVLIVLFADSSTKTAQLLSMKGFVGIGLISYSAYLWHQPLFAFARLRSVVEPSQMLMVTLAVASLTLAYLSWRYIEQPFRRRPVPVLSRRMPLFLVSGAGTAFFITLGTFGFFKEGFPSRLEAGMTERYSVMVQAFGEKPKYFGCDKFQGNFEKDISLCTAFEPETANKEFLVIGDSHAVSLLPAFSTLSDTARVRIVSGALPACPPLLTVFTTNKPSSARRCVDAMRSHAEYAVKNQVSAVFLVARWTLYTYGRFDGPDHNFLMSQEPGGARPSLEVSRINFVEGLLDTIAFFQKAGIPVVIVDQVPQQRINPKHVVERSVLLEYTAEEAAKHFRKTFVSHEDNNRIEKFAKDVFSNLNGKGVHVISLDDTFSAEGKYRWINGVKPFYVDGDHLTLAGAEFLAPFLAERVEEKLLTR